MGRRRHARQATEWVIRFAAHLTTVEVIEFQRTLQQIRALPQT